MNDGGRYLGEDASQLAGELFSGKLSAEEALKKLRARLLDLSMRNRLLNYRHPKGRSIPFVGNVDVDGLYERLEDGKQITLEYVPDPPTIEYDNGKKPDVRAYAKRLGMPTSIDLVVPSGNNRKRQDALQVLQYPADLERFARKLANEARVVVEETGTNMLYLMFGFLEFYESDDSEKPALAPLIAMPVKLEKGGLDSESRTYRYSVSYTDEDIVENFSLREKLKQEFRLHLPELTEEDTPAAYLSRVTKAVEKRHRWKILCRVSLGFLSFGKLALWVDLDPAKAEQLLSNPLLRSIFEGGDGQPTEAFHAEDYVIDQHEDADLPLIYDADSSQHSAIIDVKAGKSLVINGPPGTGKSQTITNIIASSMAHGKKVLFVSEKLAALRVVEHRLEMAGLGDFCLQLHSNKSQKKQLLESVEKRINKRYRAVNGYEAKLETLKERKKTLNKYAQILGSQIGNQLGLTVHEIFWAAERKRIEAGECAEVVSSIRLEHASEWDPQTADRCKTSLAAAAASIEELGWSPVDSPWRGFVPLLMVQGDELPVSNIVDAALAHLNGVGHEVKQLGKLTNQNEWSFDELEASLKALVLIPEPADTLNGLLLERMLPAGLTDLTAAMEDTASLSEILSKARRLDEQSRQHLVNSSVFDASFPKAADDARSNVCEEGLRKTPVDLTADAVRLRDAVETVEKVVREGISYPTNPERLLSQIDLLLALPGSGAISAVETGKICTVAAQAMREAENIQAQLHRLDAIVAPATLRQDGDADEIEALARGEITGLKKHEEELPHARSNLEDAAVHGYRDWTAERLAAQAAEYRSYLGACTEAQDRLRLICSRLQVSYSGDRDTLAQLITVVQIADDAPKDLLTFRSIEFERADFADLAIRAEEANKAVAQLHAYCEEAFSLDLLPEIKELKQHARALRRRDSFFNFFRSDWRAARRVYRDCAKGKQKLPSEVMGEKLALVVKWRESHHEYNNNESFCSTLRGLFHGTKTDFHKVRRLNAWYRKSAQLLSECGLAGALSLTTADQHLIATLSAQSSKVKTWIKTLADLFDQVSTLQQFKNRHVGKKADDVMQLLESEAERQASVCELLRRIVEPQITVGQALHLLSLQRRLKAEGEALEPLLKAPMLLREIAQPLGMNLSTFEAREIRKAAKTLLARATEVHQFASEMRSQLGDSVQPTYARAVIAALCEANSAATLVVSASVRSSCKGWLTLTRGYTEAADAAERIAEYLAPVAKPGATVFDAVHSAQAALERNEQLDTLRLDTRLNARFGDHLNGLETSEQHIHVCLNWAAAISENRRRLTPALAKSLLTTRACDTFHQVRGHLERSRVCVEKYKTEMEALRRLGEFNWDAWGGQATPKSALERIEDARDAAHGLVAWSKYCDAQQEALELQLGAIIEKFEHGLIPPCQLVTAFELALYRSLSKQILASRRELARFTGGGHERLRSEFVELDKELIKVNGAQYAHEIDKRKQVPRGIDRGRAGDLTEMALLSKETKKQKRHIPIRQLLRRAGKALQELKPCFMMGPLSVAQYLEQRLLEFDLVVMDEASQLRPEDALGAIARGKQLVVVGDPKQLPPTNFFDRLMDAEDDDADETPALIDGIESILGICEHLYRPVRTLRWHYRSRHESLIAFSNSQFYSSRLVVFPSPYKRNRLLGVNYRYVKDGVYQDRKNVTEALRIVDAVVDHMLHRPEESLGVVTLNQTQRDLIEDLLDKKLRDVQGVSGYLTKHEEAGWEFFVKNLENVQGDERDVIFISTTFGKAPGTTVVRQTFGPINRPDGWRRLNVLFTRARSRIEIFTSMLASDVIVEEGASLGRKALHDYLEYARTGVLPSVNIDGTEHEPDSDFEISVAESLRKLGYDTHPQVGVAGYFIDIGVRHPERRGEFLAGIECDGAGYHSSLSARDRDRIRQEILESLGWRGRIIRVWSTDWFADPRGQVNRLAKFLEERLRKSQADIVPYADDDLEVFTEIDSPKGSNGIASAVEEQLNDALDIYVEVGDRVTYMVLDGQETHTVQIVDSASNPKHGLLNEATPIAQALIGLTPGEDAEFEVLGQPRRTIRLVKIHRESSPATSTTL